jgi:phospholipid-binding lipoprotein MlaA
MLHDTSKAAARRGKAPYASFARGRSVCLLGFAVVSLVSISLPGCSAQRAASPIRDAQDQKAFLSSDPPSPIQTSDSLGELDYDPWESFNEKTFFFNFNVLDRYALKPAAKVWAGVLPQSVRQSLANAFDNLAMPRRFVNKVLQGRFPGAGQELARSLINTTAGFAGFFDVASRLGLHKNDADTGETLAVYGVGPGPYLVLPLLPPLTVRDAIGYAADSFMDPLSYFVTPLAADVGRGAANTINERAANMTLYQDVEDTSLDLYAAVRNGYLQRRRNVIQDAIRDRDLAWRSLSDRFEPHGESMLGEDGAIEE